MKKTALLLLVILVIVLLAACSNSSSSDTTQENEPIFTEEDIGLAKEMIAFIQQKESEFVEVANQKLNEERSYYEQYESVLEGQSADLKIQNDFIPLANDMVLNPFLEEYGERFIKNDHAENLEFRVNVKTYDETGESVSLEEFQIVPGYENLTLEDPIIEYHEQYDVHELIFPVNEESTNIFNAEKKNSDSLQDRFTFYKTEDGQLIFGIYEPVMNRASVFDFEDAPEDVQEDLEALPPLQ